jgi:hypothetical protein
MRVVNQNLIQIFIDLQKPPTGSRDLQVKHNHKNDTFRTHQMVLIYIKDKEFTAVDLTESLSIL